MCHAHSDGPDGAAPGQIGGLSASEREKLGISRLAMDPGKKIDNPILNAFGNEIIHQIGRNKFLEIKKTPQHLDQVYSKESDLDHDGIPDIQEYYEGTHPLMPHDGNPWKLFKVNLLRNQMQIGLVILATIFGVWGFRSALIGFANSTKADEENDE
jgi:hypothetical protein